MSTACMTTLIPDENQVNIVVFIKLEQTAFKRPCSIMFTIKEKSTFFHEKIH